MVFLISKKEERTIGTLQSSIALQDKMTPIFISMNIEQIQMAQVELARVDDILEKNNDNLEENKKAQENFNNSVKSGQSAMGALEKKVLNLLSSFISLQNVQKVLGLSDTMVQTTAKLDIMNDGLQATKQLQDKVFLSAERSRSSYLATADAVSKMSAIAGNAFNGNEEIIAFSEQLNKQFVISATSAQGIDTVMNQLTQAMGEGVLKGEAFTNVLETAPTIAQSIADYMGMPVEQVNNLAQEGLLTSGILKNALFSSAEETNARFSQMPMTFSQIFTSIQNQALMAFEPILLKLSEIASSEKFQNMVAGMVNALVVVSGIVLTILNVIASVGGFMYDNWSVLEPIIMGVVTALGLYTVALVGNSILEGVHTVQKALGTIAEYNHAKAILANSVAYDKETVSKAKATVAQATFNTTLLANPLTWIILIIALVIVAIIRWVKAVGGIKIAWMIAMNAIKTAGDWAWIGIMTGIYWVMDLFNKLQLSFARISTAIANLMGDMRVSVLLTLQNMVNGAIDIINSFIGVLNKIPGVNIELIDHVTFGSKAQLENEAEKQKREASLSEYEKRIESQINQRALSLEQMKEDARVATAKREAEIAAARKEAELSAQKEEESPPIPEYSPYNPENTFKYEPENNNGYSPENYGDTVSNIADTANNTGQMAESMDKSATELKYLREIAERQAINKFTTAEIKIDMQNMRNEIKSDTDIDGLVYKFADKLEEVLLITAEGVPV